MDYTGFVVLGLLLLTWMLFCLFGGKKKKKDAKNEKVKWPKAW